MDELSNERGNLIKHQLRQQGLTLKSFAERNALSYRDVSDVVRGVRKGNFGKGREIVDLLKATISRG